MDPLALAVESLTLQEKPNISATAKEFNVHRSTLSRRFNGVTQSTSEKAANQGLLSQQQEKSLVKYINELTTRGLPPTPAMLCQFAFDIAGVHPGKSWSQRFRKRWSHTLQSRYLSNFDASRKKADVLASYEVYFTLVEEKIQQYDIQPSNMYNMDEKGFLIGVMKKSKRIFTKSAYSSKQLLGHVQDGNREWITVLATICADGSWLPPGLIYKASTGNLQTSWVQDFDSSSHQAYFASSPTGWTNEDLGFEYLKGLFDKATRGKAGRS